MRTLAALAACVVAASPSLAQRFYPDDPLEKVPALWPTPDPRPRALSSILELLQHGIGPEGERHPESGVIPASGVNTLGEVMDGPWYENRHARRRMTPQELRRGPGDQNAPARDAPWRILTLKKYGFRPGILLADSKDEIYLLRFDPPGHLEMATGAEAISSRIFHALGYHVLESYVVYFEREQLAVGPGAERVTSAGGRQDLLNVDVVDFLEDVARDPERGFRAVATRLPRSWDGVLGPYQVFGTRRDDPNDVVPHEHRREQRGLFVFSAWLNHVTMRAVNTLDALVTENGVPFIRHYLVDFVATLGSGGFEPKDAREGHETIFDFVETVENVAGMGVFTREWMRADYGDYDSVGRFESGTFEPERWQPNVVVPPFANRLPDDTFWAAKQLAAFTDDDVRALVSAGRYSDPDAEAWVAECLIERRDAILAAYFAAVLPLVGFDARGESLQFTDLEVEHGFSGPRSYTVLWSHFDNETEEHREIGDGLEAPPAAAGAEDGSYFAARVSAGEEGESTIAYFRVEQGELELVGLDYDWPGKKLARPAVEPDGGPGRYAELADGQRRLFDDWAARQDVTPPGALFDSLTTSERATFDAVTHALMSSELTDQHGGSLGRAIDLVDRVERIAGQHGVSGDEPYRLYVGVRGDAREVLSRSREFTAPRANSVYHAGYPYSYRQRGGPPSLQLSISEDGVEADIDVDYRSSTFPAAMFNGNLTWASSDVRAGDHHERHRRRWRGFTAWWLARFGPLPFSPGERAGPDLFSREPPEPPTPLPPNRRPGEEPDALHEAAQEFLTDWLVREDLDEAVRFVSPAFGAGARGALGEAMERANDELGDVDTLTEAIDVVRPWPGSMRILSHPFEEDFTLVEIGDPEARHFLGVQAPGAPDGYLAAIFRWKIRGGGVLGLVWTREEGNWRIVAYEALQP